MNSKDFDGKKLKEEFIKYFGEEKWNQEEILAELLPLEYYICNNLGINPIPVIVEDIAEDSRFYPKDEYIAISSALIVKPYEAMKCLFHELRHAYQYVCVTRNLEEESLLELWKEEFKWMLIKCLQKIKYVFP